MQGYANDAFTVRVRLWIL